MADPPVNETTKLLRAWAGGDEEALGLLTPRVYVQLRRMAGHVLRNERAGTLQSVDLVHEVYLRLIDIHQIDWQHRAHFFAICAMQMRRILLDRARKRKAAKRGGGRAVLDLDAALNCSPERSAELIALDDALNTLAKVDPRKAQVVELRFFGGLTVEETAEVIHVSSDTVMRDWKTARAWLLTQLKNRG